ncbi:FUSC family protein [Pantoea sp. RIT-PI-b]|uniref:FUSC family protein n=1 Tax=Pantoea sp. RIT-PI-b TaxID=1681195 RepID=UPI0006760A62|nr:FUSC family protein [Pantoea sp. RIT-PI-b]
MQSRTLSFAHRFVLQCDLTTPRATYILRSLIAANLALVVAYALELDMPYSAATTVLLVLNPVQGAVLGKGKWRLIGTLVGMVVALALMAAFAQLPWLFMLAESLWLGVCVMAMSVLRHFRASGAAVAGYTIGLATLGAMQHPDLAFAHAVGRASTVAIGVMSLGLVTALFSRRTLSSKLDALLLRLTQQTATLLAMQGPPAAQHRLMSEIYSVDDLLAAARQESVTLAQHSRAIQQAMDALGEMVASGVSQPAAIWQRVADALAQGRAGLPTARHLLLDACADKTQPQTHIDAMQRVVQVLSYLPYTSSSPRLVAPSFHRDWSGARRNGLRATLTLLAASLLWLGSGWPAGDIMLLIIAPYCALLSASPQPAAGAQQFLRGTLYALPMALICAFLVLPLINGLPLLLLVLSLFWLPGIYVTSYPQHILSGLAYLVGFNTLTAASNPMVYDVTQFLNWSLAWLTGTALTLLAFQLMPRNPARHVQRLRARIRLNSLALLAGKAAKPLRWQQQQQHRLAQLGALLRTQPQAQDLALQQGLASLQLGREVLRLRALAIDSPWRSQIVTAQQRIARRAGNPLQAAKHAQRTARLLRGDATLAAGFSALAQLLQQHADYFSPQQGGDAHVK